MANTATSNAPSMYGPYTVGANNQLSLNGTPVAAQNTAPGAAASMDAGTIAQHMYDAGVAQGRSASSLQASGPTDLNYWEGKIQGQGGLTPYWQGRLDTGNQAGPSGPAQSTPVIPPATTAPVLNSTSTPGPQGGALGQVNAGGNQAAISAALATQQTPPTAPTGG